VKPPFARTQRELTRFAKFLVVGTFGAVVDFGTFNLLTNAVHLPTIPSSAMSFTAAVISNFLWNRHWTYPDSRSKPISRQATQFIGVSLVGLLIRTPVYAVGERLLLPVALALFPVLQGRPALRLVADVMGSPLVLGRNMALAVAVVIVLFWNFFVNRVWTYSDVQ
jgi:putative flippase GtrA